MPRIIGTTSWVKDYRGKIAFKALHQHLIMLEFRAISKVFHNARSP